MACQELLVALRRKYNSFFFDIPWQRLKEQHLSLLRTDKHQYRYGVFDEGKAVGWVIARGRDIGGADPSLVSNLDADYERIPREFSMTVGAELEKLLEKYGLQELEYMANCRRTVEPAEHWMGKRVNILNRFQLERTEANYNIMDRWLSEFPEKFPSLRLEFHKVIPDKYLVRFAELFTQFMNEMPRERDRGRKYNIGPEILRNLDEWRRANDRFLFIYTMHDDRDNMTGFTNAMVAGHDPSNAYQAMTGVTSEYRGKGLSKWLKAALFRKIGEDFPDNKYMTTDMRAVNFPIQKVNEQMGYKLISEGAEYSVSLESLRQSLMK